MPNISLILYSLYRIKDTGVKEQQPRPPLCLSAARALQSRPTLESVLPAPPPGGMGRYRTAGIATVSLIRRAGTLATALIPGSPQPELCRSSMSLPPEPGEAEFQQRLEQLGGERGAVVGVALGVLIGRFSARRPDA